MSEFLKDGQTLRSYPLRKFSPSFVTAKDRDDLAATCHIVANFLRQFGIEPPKASGCAITGPATPLDPDAVLGETTWLHEIRDLCVGNGSLPSQAEEGQQRPS